MLTLDFGEDRCSKLVLVPVEPVLGEIVQGVHIARDILVIGAGLRARTGT